ncbi:restriction endonuclease subunit S [Succinivibrio dextrinosolvens]|uniref:Type I restriction enzyme, S subunit n=1 Tax=Succinivibrio dextrinosolvens TaxID=83771 RepID=A0A662Z8Q5_9GAMM|nr:restriction endonuclease subunit S [Succinivibrio dextrinosolvens]SFK04544.1 type I restriction enzyme, S subunit [Succinivibrio dextrinosolvens]
MNTELIKKKILDLAIRGRLVEQRPEEGTAEELYAQIQEEKKKLIEDGKIKKEKPLPEITEDEIPFDIPESWKWVRIPEISYFQEGPGILAQDFRKQGIPLLRLSGLSNEFASLKGCNYLDPLMVKERWSHFSLEKGDIVISTSASMDKISEIDEDTAGSIPYTGIIRFKMFCNVNKTYFKYFLQSSYYAKQVNQNKKGDAIKHYGPTHLKKFNFSLPPLSEQKRIVDKVEEIFSRIDVIEKTKGDLAKDGKLLEKKILDLAIRGKLVEQRPEDGTAEELYSQIQEEKKKLIADGKIKKEKPLPEITKDEIPFEIPESWKWVYLGDISSIYGGKRIPAGRQLILR